MLIREGTHRTHALDLRLAASLAVIAGAINASAFYAVGFFSANMTGNVSTFSGHIVLGNLAAAAFLFGVVVAFIAGAMLSTLLIALGRRRGIQRIYGRVILLEAVLLAAAAGIDLYLKGSGRTAALILDLAFSMGLQNALVTRISSARIRTTHVSGIITDIGIELANVIDVLRGKLAQDGPSEKSTSENVLKLRLHLYTLLAFAVGCVAGVFVYRSIGGALFFVAAALLVVIARWGTGGKGFPVFGVRNGAALVIPEDVRRDEDQG